MRLFNKTIDRQLFKQYALGSDLSKQEVVVKIFNPTGNGRWYILNSDPEDPDYLWAIVDLGYGAEVGSVSRSDLENYRGRFGMGFERDLSFDPVNALELYNGLSDGKYYADGGEIEVVYERRADFKKKPIKLLLLSRGKEQKGYTFSGKDQVAVLDNYNRNKQEDLERLWNLKGYESKYADGGNIEQNKPYIFFFYNENGDELTFSTLEKARAEAKKQGVQKVRDNLGGEYFLNYADGGTLNKTKLFTKEDDQKLFKQHQFGKDLTKQDAVLEIYQNVGNIHYYIINADPKDPNNLLAIIQNDISGETEVDFVSRSQIQTFAERVGGTRKTIDYTPINALELYNGLSEGKYYADGGNIADFTDNQQMIMNQNVELEHHHEELEDILEDEMPVPAWVVAKMATATQSVSDITHYLDGQKELMEDEEEEVRSSEFFPVEDEEDEIENKEVVEPINVSAGTKAELTKKFTDDAMGNLKGFLKGMEGIDLRDDYTFDYKDEQYEVEPIINSDENGVSNAVFTIFDGDGEEVGEIAYSREGGKQKFTANSEFFSWNNAKFEDGGFMNNVYADGGYFDGTIPKVSTYMSTYAKGGEVAKAEILGLSKNILGTTSIEMKISAMRKPQDFSVYPIGKDDSKEIITIQSETRIGKIDLSTGRGLMSQSHSNGAYFVHFQMDKLIPFTISESDLEDLKMQIFKTAGDNVGSRGIVSDNSGASGVYADGGKTDKKFYSLDQIEYDIEYRDKNGEKYSEIFSTKDEALKEIYRLEKLGFVVTSRTRSFKDDGTFNGYFSDGGETEEGVDLFEDYDNIPPKLQDVLDKYEYAFQDGDYRDLEKALKEVNKLGYTFEYYLDGQAYDLRKIGEKGKSEVEEYAKGGSVKKDWWQTVVNPNEDFNNYDDKKPIDWEVDDFKSWVVSNSDLDGNVDKEVLEVVKMPKSKLTVEYLNKNGSGKNKNEYYKEFGNWQSALYDIFTQMKKDYLFKKSRKYILKADIKTVTVNRKGKEITYNASDVLNGAYVLAKGGDITSKANYVGKNDIVEVELKDGSKVKPANGYWIKKGAEPVGAEPTPTASGKSEIKVGETEIRKDMRGNWRAETTVDNFNGYDWRISTVKTYSGNLVSSAQGGKTEPTGSKGIKMFIYTMYQDPNHTLEVSKPKRLTDKVVTEQHDKALAKFKKFMETGTFGRGGKISKFDKLSAKVAKEYEGKPVKSQYQEEYGKYYSKGEAQEVGDKVAGKVKAMQLAKK
jgi:hypothetical protein